MTYSCCCGCFTENGILTLKISIDNDKWSVFCVFAVTVFFGGITYGRRTCNYAEILSSYKELIFIELQNLNLTGPYSLSKEINRCPSGKVQHILRSIYGMTELFKCQGKGRWFREIGRPVERMGQLIRQNCKLADLMQWRNNPHCKTGKVLRGRKKKKKTVEALEAEPNKTESMAGVDMDPELARGLFEEGATLVLLGVPEGTELGMDYKSWQVGPRFRGVKMIPPGLHFLHYSSVNTCRGGEVGPKMGLFLSLQPREVLLAHWNKQEEDLDFSASQNVEEISRVKAGLRDLDPFLGPYPYETLRKWVSLTDKLTKEVASGLQPLSGRICAFSEVMPELQLTHTKDREQHNMPRNDTECQSMREGLERLPRMKEKPGTEIRFSLIPKQTYPDGATPAQITQYSMDLSYALDCLLESHYKEEPLHVLGELQFAFVCFLIGNVYEGFEHWKRLLALLCRAEAAMRTRRDLYLGLIAVLYHQLGEVPPDFFVDIVSQDNFLTSTLQEFFQFSSGPGVDGTLRKRAERFKAHLTKKFRWNFDVDPDDDAPVVVELPEGFTLD
ncbi:hypothetical protein AGOR_G00136870 [Albula goreensis]|uniref:Protein AAR2 homolog n=1 Tax=Albula goreensis TaxID=1534307 RepID=A0A8T3D9K3_9TELE|nr:hypothetical protein AGOR_G00136870 [Albula goreensis]